ncbi:MAG: hypothetical protein Q7S32_02605 [bacterium]|nr:hypothetical protein [bacterium]
MFSWRWQYIIPIISIFANIDFVVLPLIRSLGVGGLNLFLVVLPLALIELYAWYWFWDWFRKVAVPEMVAKKIAQDERVQEAISLGKEIKIELKQSGRLQQIVEYFFRTFSSATDENSRLFKKIRRGGHVVMFLMGAEPWPGGRTVGVIFCGATGWKRGFYTLALGNVVHVAYVVGLWNLIFSGF